MRIIQILICNRCNHRNHQKDIPPIRIYIKVANTQKYIHHIEKLLLGGYSGYTNPQMCSIKVKIDVSTCFKKAVT